MTYLYKEERGFTLIELLTVIGIISLLSSVVLSSLSSARAKSRDIKRVASIAQMQKALELYYDANQSYPISEPAGYTGNDAALQMLYGVGFLQSVPTAGGFMYYGGVEAQSPFTECTAGLCRGYMLATVLEREDNSALQQDADVQVINGVTIAEGNSSDCGTTASAPDLCLDRTPLQIQT